MLRKIGTIAMLSALLYGCDCLNCDCPPEPELADLMVGEYELFIGSNQQFSNDDFLSSSLTIDGNGTYNLKCVNTDKTQADVSGKWTVNVDTIGFERFVDCAGVWRADWSDTGAHLIIQCVDPPIILLDPDVNIFYRKLS